MVFGDFVWLIGGHDVYLQKSSTVDNGREGTHDFGVIILLEI